MTKSERILAWIIGIAAAWVLLDILILQGLIPSFDGSDEGTSGAGALAVNDAAHILLAAITKAENVASYHNNPGGICGGYDQNEQCTGPKTFATIEEGTAAALALINKYLVANPSITLAQFIQKWTGGATSDYMSTMQSETGLGPNDPAGNAGNSGGAGADSEDDSGFDDEDNPGGGGSGDDDQHPVDDGDFGYSGASGDEE